MRKAQMVHAREALKRLGFKEVGDYLRFKTSYGTIEISIDNFATDPEAAFDQAIDWFIAKALTPKPKVVEKMDQYTKDEKKETKKAKK